MSREKYPHYYKYCPYEYVDVYRVLELFEVTDQAVGHAIKKLLVSGKRGHKDIKKDIKEAIVTLTRRVEMWEEEPDAPAYTPFPEGTFDSRNSESFETDKEDLKFIEQVKGYDGKLWPDTMDAVVWALEFHKIYPEVDLGLTIAWFSNAIMRGYDQKYWDSDEYKSMIEEVINDKKTKTDYGIEIKPADSLGPLPSVVQKIPVLTEEEMNDIIKRMKKLGD